MSTDNQATADLRRAVRRCTESATHEQLEAMQEGWTFAADHEYRQAPIVRDGVQVGVLSVPVKAGEPTMARYDEDPLGDIAAPGQRTQTLTPVAQAMLDELAASYAKVPTFTPGQRVTIPARLLGNENHGQRVAVVVERPPFLARSVGYENAVFVEVGGWPAFAVPIGEVQP